MNGLAMRKRAMQSVMEGNTLQRARLGILRSTIGRMSEEVTFSPGEKLILLMLADLHDHLKIKSETDTKLLRAAIHSGNVWVWA